MVKSTTMVEISIRPPKREDNGQILHGSPVVNSAIIENGVRTIDQIRGLDGVAPQMITQIYDGLEPDPERGYVTYQQVAEEMNYRLGIDWVTSADIDKYSRAVHHGENTYPLEQVARAHLFIQELTGECPRNILGLITDPDNDQLIFGDHSNHEAMQARNIARATMLYRGNPELRRYFFETTAEYLQSAHNQADRHDSRKIYKGHLLSLGGQLNQPYIFDPDEAYFPRTLITSKKLINQITIQALVGLRERPDLLSLPSELDLLVATGYLYGMTQDEIGAFIRQTISQSYDDMDPTRDDVELAEVYPPSYTIGRWFHWLTGAPMRPCE